MTAGQLRERAAVLRAIPLAEVLRAVGARPDPYDRAKWHTLRGPLSITGCKFMNWRSGNGGGGAIDLVMHLQGLDFKATLSWLGERFPGAWRPQGTAGAFHPPPAEERHLGRVREYLCRERGLNPEALWPLMGSGTVYADGRANAVFLLRCGQGQPVGAELRGTTLARWRGLAPGSRRDSGYFRVGLHEAGQIVLCESAIDALSCVTLHPRALCVSTSGARAQPAWLPGLLAKGYEIYCGFDSDQAGESAAQAMQAAFPAVRRLRPSLHDWNDELKATRGK
jgi:hypothetical protein